MSSSLGVASVSVSYEEPITSQAPSSLLETAPRRRRAPAVDPYLGVYALHHPSFQAQSVQQPTITNPAAINSIVSPVHSPRRPSSLTHAASPEGQANIDSTGKEATAPELTVNAFLRSTQGTHLKTYGRRRKNRFTLKGQSDGSDVDETRHPGGASGCGSKGNVGPTVIPSQQLNRSPLAPVPDVSKRRKRRATVPSHHSNSSSGESEQEQDENEAHLQATSTKSLKLRAPSYLTAPRPEKMSPAVPTKSTPPRWVRMKELPFPKPFPRPSSPLPDSPDRPDSPRIRHDRPAPTTSKFAQPISQFEPYALRMPNHAGPSKSASPRTPSGPTSLSRRRLSSSLPFSAGPGPLTLVHMDDPTAITFNTRIRKSPATLPRRKATSSKAQKSVNLSPLATRSFVPSHDLVNDTSQSVITSRPPQQILFTKHLPMPFFAGRGLKASTSVANKKKDETAASLVNANFSTPKVFGLAESRPEADLRDPPIVSDARSLSLLIQSPPASITPSLPPITPIPSRTRPPQWLLASQSIPAASTFLNIPNMPSPVAKESSSKLLPDYLSPCVEPDAVANVAKDGFTNLDGDLLPPPRTAMLPPWEIGSAFEPITTVKASSAEDGPESCANSVLTSPVPHAPRPGAIRDSASPRSTIPSSEASKGATGDEATALMTYMGSLGTVPQVHEGYLLPSQHSEDEAEARSPSPQAFLPPSTQAPRRFIPSTPSSSSGASDDESHGMNEEEDEVLPIHKADNGDLLSDDDLDNPLPMDFSQHRQLSPEVSQLVSFAHLDASQAPPISQKRLSSQRMTWALSAMSSPTPSPVLRPGFMTESPTPSPPIAVISSQLVTTSQPEEEEISLEVDELVSSSPVGQPTFTQAPPDLRSKLKKRKIDNFFEDSESEEEDEGGLSPVYKKLKSQTGGHVTTLSARALGKRRAASPLAGQSGQALEVGTEIVAHSSTDTRVVRFVEEYDNRIYQLSQRSEWVATPSPKKLVSPPSTAEASSTGRYSPPSTPTASRSRAVFVPDTPERDDRLFVDHSNGAIRMINGVVDLDHFFQAAHEFQESRKAALFGRSSSSGAGPSRHREYLPQEDDAE